MNEQRVIINDSHSTIMAVEGNLNSKTQKHQHLENLGTKKRKKSL
jgi:hypothetical protein